LLLLIHTQHISIAANICASRATILLLPPIHFHPCPTPDSLQLEPTVQVSSADPTGNQTGINRPTRTRRDQRFIDGVVGAALKLFMPVLNCDSPPLSDEQTTSDVHIRVRCRIYIWQLSQETPTRLFGGFRRSLDGAPSAPNEQFPAFRLRQLTSQLFHFNVNDECALFRSVSIRILPKPC
jgi:hypothetical protein